MPTDRQLRVLGLLAEGCQNSEIGARLFICESTVKGHIRALQRRAEARNRTHLVACAFRNGWLS